MFLFAGGLPAVCELGHMPPQVAGSRHWQLVAAAGLRQACTQIIMVGTGIQREPQRAGGDGEGGVLAGEGRALGREQERERARATAREEEEERDGGTEGGRRRWRGSEGRKYGGEIRREGGREKGRGMRGGGREK